MTAPRAWVLLHGTPLDPEVWRELTPILHAEQPVVTPVAAPSPGDRRPQKAVAERLIDRLTEAADRWDLVGHSFGGQVAMELALLLPARIATLTIICSRDTPFPAFARTAADLRDGAAVDVDGALQRWFRPAELNGDSWLVSYARDRLRNADRAVWATALDGIATYDRSDEVTSIQVPTTLICAGLDPVPDPMAMTAMSERIPQAHLHVLHDAAHMSPLLDPRSLAAWLPGNRP